MCKLARCRHSHCSHLGARALASLHGSHQSPWLSTRIHGCLWKRKRCRTKNQSRCRMRRFRCPQKLNRKKSLKNTRATSRQQAAMPLVMTSTCVLRGCLSRCLRFSGAARPDRERSSLQLCGSPAIGVAAPVHWEGALVLPRVLGGVPTGCTDHAQCVVGCMPTAGA